MQKNSRAATFNQLKGMVSEKAKELETATNNLSDLNTEFDQKKLRTAAAKENLQTHPTKQDSQPTGEQQVTPSSTSSPGDFLSGLDYNHEEFKTFSPVEAEELEKIVNKVKEMMSHAKQQSDFRKANQVPNVIIAAEPQQEPSPTKPAGNAGGRRGPEGGEPPSKKPILGCATEAAAASTASGSQHPIIPILPPTQDVQQTLQHFANVPTPPPTSNGSTLTPGSQ